MKTVANKKTERKYKSNKTLLVNEKVINIKHRIIRLLSFSITIQYSDRLECHPGHRFFSDDLCRNEPINARQLRANGVWSRLLNNILKGLRDRTCKPLKSQRDMSNQCMIDAFGLQVRQRYTPLKLCWNYFFSLQLSVAKFDFLCNRCRPRTTFAFA